MQSPQTPGAGITGAATKSLGGDALQSIESGPETQRCYGRALHFHRVANALLFLVRHDMAVRLARRAAELQLGAAL
jgi:hypothetical protein